MFSMIVRRITGCLMGSLLLLGASPLAMAGGESARVETRLAPSAVGVLGSQGATDYKVKAARRDFNIEIENVPLGNYQFFVNGVERGTITVAPSPSENRGQLEFSDPPRTGRLPLDFEPDGALFEVKQQGVVILAALAPFIGQPGVGGGVGGGAATFSRQSVKLNMTVQDGSRSSGKLEFKSSKNKARLKASFKKLPPAHYILTSNAMTVHEFDSTGRETKVEFSSAPKPNELLLSFDPLNSDYQLTREGVLVLSGALTGQPIGNGVLPLGEVQRPFTNLGLDTDAVGRARLITRAGRVDFNIEVEDLPAGTYAILVDGLQVADIILAPSEGGTEGEVEFRAPTTEPGKLLLTFDPQGRTIQITAGAMVYLSLVF